MNKVKYAVFGLVAVLVIPILMGGCATTGEPEVEVIKVGYMGPLSGDWAPWGITESISKEIYIDQINANGGVTVQGKTYNFELVKYDNQGDAAIQLSVGRQGIDDGLKFVSTCYEAATVATNDLFTENKILNLASCAGKEGSIGPEWPYTFKCWFSNRDGQGVLLEYLGQTFPDKRRVVGLHSDDAGGRASMDEFVEACEAQNFNLVEQLFYASDATEFHTVLTSIKEMDVDYLELGTSPTPAMGLIMKQGREVGFEGTYLLTDSIDVGTYEEVTGYDALEGTYATPALTEFPTQMGREWNEEFLERYGSPFTSQAIHGDMMWILKNALEKADTFDVDELVKVIEADILDLSYGPTGFRGKELYGLDRYIVVPTPVIQVRNGELVDVTIKTPPRWR